MKRLSALFLIALGGLAQTPPAKAPAATPAPGATAPAREPGLYAIFNTSMGTFTAKLFETETPVTVRNFAALARGTKPWKDPKTNAMAAKPMYNNITFHRVIKNFMIQTGDPTATGSHDCGFTIKDEIVPSLKFDQPGRLGMANIGSPNTGGCQFFVTAVPYPSLNGGYTVFGQVVEGQDIVNKIDNVPTDRNDKPVTPVKLISVTIKREGPAPAAATPAKKAAPATKSTAAPKKQ
ncbi:MAG TPA: peptidylprolyl isomerase [Candidatus Acidoferrales bacterium]|nr:peptidylprolyl isomerase [Candidatus Acidoferrales bacterium]